MLILNFKTMKKDYLDDTLLQNAFFYPACGGDMQPLFRFPMNVSAFIYADFDCWGKELEYCINEFNNDYVNSGFSIEIEDRRTGLLSDLTNLSDHNKAMKILENTLGMDKMDKCPYFSSKSDTYFTEIYDMSLKVKDKRINFKVYFIHAEAYSLYLRLFRLGAISPKFLCTVISDWIRFEYNMPDIIKNLESKPQICLTSSGSFDGYNVHLGSIYRWDGTCERYTVKLFAREGTTPDPGNCGMKPAGGE
jgi:hypothetical protein